VRCFIAIELPQNIRQAIVAISAPLRQECRRATWVAAGNLHLTVRYLGSLSDRELESIDRGLREIVSDLPRFTLRIHGLGAFPSQMDPKVLWMGASTSSNGLDALQSRCESIARNTGLAPDTRNFHPHVTFARVKSPLAIPLALNTLQPGQLVDAGEFEVPGVSLFQSELTPRGPIYTRHQEYLFS